MGALLIAGLVSCSARGASAREEGDGAWVEPLAGGALLEARPEWARGKRNAAGGSTGAANARGAARDDSSGPDLIVADLQSLRKWGRVGDITAYSVGTTVCNVGDQPALWVLNTNEHPIVPQHMYRLKDGRFEQIGMSWSSHTFFALNQTFCDSGCVPLGGSYLGVHCSDFHSTSINGLQQNLAGRWEVNAATADFPYPWTSPVLQLTIGRRLQVHDADLDPPQNDGALYFVEGHYLTADEALAGNDENNVSYRRIQVIWGGGHGYDIGFVPGHDTQRESPALMAWQDVDPAVAITQVDIASDGRMMLAYKVTDAGGGQYHYEYALYNMNSDRSGQSFSIPVPAGVTVSNFGFHDVDYHSGEPVDLTDWAPTLAGASLTWETLTYAVDPDANALRWGTTYNFRFDADVPPGLADATIGLFKPGSPSSITMPALGPVPLTGADCNSNGVDDALDIFGGTSDDCNRTGIPDECDIAAGTSFDCTGNGTPDECEPDCNVNAVPDDCDIAQGTSVDCNSNATPDECDTDCNTNAIPDDCDVAAGTSDDCDTNGAPDECDLASGADTDCNTNGVLDQCDFAGGTSADCDQNSLPDECDIASGTAADCNTNTVPDACEIVGGTAEDCNNNAVPDECESNADCNANGFADICDLFAGTSSDCNGNAVPDECDLSGGTSTDCNTNGTPDDCEATLDCNSNGVSDVCDVVGGTSLDCNSNLVPDECESGADCNTNGVADICDIATRTSADCNGNIVPDECDVATGVSGDCNTNGVPDDCDVVGGTSADTNQNAVPDECEALIPAVSGWGLIVMAPLVGLAGIAVFRRRHPGAATV